MPTGLTEPSRKENSSLKSTTIYSYQATHHGFLQDASLLLGIPVESLIHITSFLSPPSLLALSRTNRRLYEHVKDDNTWYRAFINQFLYIGPENDFKYEKILLLRKSESTWRKEFIMRHNLRRCVDVFLHSAWSNLLSGAGKVRVMEQLLTRRKILLSTASI